MFFILYNHLKRLSKILLKLYSSKYGYIYKLQDIDACKNEVIIYCKGTGTILHNQIQEIACDDYIIKNLPPHHASWIGYHYGKYWQKNRASQTIKSKLIEFNTNNSFARYNLVCHDRSGDITYLDTKYNITYKTKASLICQNKIILKFDSEQAFFIGFLSGIENLKQQGHTQSTQNNRRKPFLTVVK